MYSRKGSTLCSAIILYDIILQHSNTTTPMSNVRVATRASKGKKGRRDNLEKTLCCMNNLEGLALG
jgi:hypothetical protein